jgi:alpha/beta hydrolase fold
MQPSAVFDIRLAPEHPFPAALHDVAAVAVWLSQHGAELVAELEPAADSGLYTISMVLSLYTMIYSHKEHTSTYCYSEVGASRSCYYNSPRVQFSHVYQQQLTWRFNSDKRTSWRSSLKRYR